MPGPRPGLLTLGECGIPCGGLYGTNRPFTTTLTLQSLPPIPATFCGNTLRNSRTTVDTNCRRSPNVILTRITYKSPAAYVSLRSCPRTPRSRPSRELELRNHLEGPNRRHKNPLSVLGPPSVVDTPVGAMAVRDSTKTASNDRAR